MVHRTIITVEERVNAGPELDSEGCETWGAQTVAKWYSLTHVLITSGRLRFNRCSSTLNGAVISPKTDSEALSSPLRSARYWAGGELARLLNADSDLTQMLYSEGLDCLEIRPDVEHKGRESGSKGDVYRSKGRIATSCALK